MAAKKNTTKKLYVVVDPYGDVIGGLVLEGMVDVKEAMEFAELYDDGAYSLYELTKVGTLRPAGDVVLTRTNGTVEVIR